MSKQLKKSVSFTSDTIDPKIPAKCFNCGHRNIKPQIRTMLSCEECNKPTCLVCLNTMLICLTCEHKLLFGNLSDEGGSEEDDEEDYEWDDEEEDGEINEPEEDGEINEPEEDDYRWDENEDDDDEENDE